MIRSHIGFTQECGVVFKLERFSHLSNRSFALGSPIRFGYLSETKPISLKKKRKLKIPSLNKFNAIFHWIYIFAFFFFLIGKITNYIKKDKGTPIGHPNSIQEVNKRSQKRDIRENKREQRTHQPSSTPHPKKNQTKNKDHQL